jgi:hypothetical protein
MFDPLAGSAMAKLRWWLPLLAVVTVATAVHADEIKWQEAVARLAQERTQAETCVQVLKKYGDAAAIGRGEIAYGEAKADYDGIIGGLIVALALKEQPASLSDLQARLERGFAKRAAFCQSVKPLIPPSSGQKGIIEEIVKGVAGPLVEAVKAIWLRSRDDNVLTRATIQTQLEATSWPAFASVSPSP